MKYYLLLFTAVFLFIVGCNSPVKTDNQQVQVIFETLSRKERLEKFKQQFEEATNDIDRLKALVDAAIEADDFPEEREKLLQHLADFVETVSDCEVKVYAYNTLILLNGENKISLSFIYFQKALELLPKFPEYREILKADAYTAIAFVTSLFHDFASTQQYLLEAIPVLEAQSEKDYQKIKEKTGVVLNCSLLTAYMTADLLYKFYEDQEKVEEYANRLLIVVERTTDLYYRALGYLSYAQSFLRNEPEKAYEYIEKGFGIGMDNQYMGIVYMACDVFSMYEELNDNIPAAISWLEKCLEYLEGKPRPFIEMAVLYNLAYLYGIDHNNEEKHLELCFKVLTLADSLNANNYLAYTYEMLGNHYAYLGNYKEAYLNKKKYIALMDELKSEESIREIEFLNARFDSERREMKILEMAKKEKVRKIQIFTGLCISVIMLTLLWYMLYLRTRRNRALAEMNATKDKFFSIISHDLKNPAMAQRDAIRQLVKNTDLWNKDELTNYCRNLLKSADEEVELLYSLLSWAQIQTGGMSFKPVTFDLPTHLSTDISLIRKLAESKKITLTDHIPNHAAVTGDINMIVTVVRNLLTNAVKFTPVGGHVSLTIEAAQNDKYTVTISDNGIGMTHEEIDNLFCIDNLLSRKGTIDEQGTGLGLLICKELLEKHGSVLCIESEEGKGSRFWFEI
ncbi:MAG: HAMP domain-containing histidine kinase [Bacteroidales bacterium]|jgi:signal transduction histidine kinase|nr:HAMP domain-containing histidine kinase [Bacteroidales bacterium]